MGATAILLSVALDASIGLGPPEMECGFPARTNAEPPIMLEVAASASLYGAPGKLSVQLDLTTGTSDMRMVALAQPLGPDTDPFLMISGSPMTDIHFSVGLKGDGSASLTIRDTRRGEDNAAEVTRIGRCHDHENFFMLFARI